MMKIKILFILFALFAFTGLQAQAQVVSCPELRKAVNNSNVDAGPLLAACFQKSAGKEVQLPHGLFFLKTRIKIAGPISITGTSSSGGPCTTDPASCTTLRAANDGGTDREPPFIITGSGVHLKNLIFDGDRWNRPSAPAVAICQGGSNRQGFLISAVNLKNSSFRGTTLMNAICGTGAELSGVTENVVLDHVTVAQNGDNSKNMLWADGVTIHNGVNVTVTNSRFVDNTDVQLIFGGCRNCKIQKNEFFHTADKRHASFTALLLHAWPGQAGDFSGTVTSDNLIDCNGNCGHGLGIGGYPWYKTPTFGGQVTNNVVRGAFVGINIDTLSGPMEFGPNAVETTVQGKAGCMGGKNMSVAAVNVSSASLSHLSAASQKNLKDAGARFGAKGYTNKSSCIVTMQKSSVSSFLTADLSGGSTTGGSNSGSGQNPTNGDGSGSVNGGNEGGGGYTPAPGACTAAQPAPHWGMKNGMCLPSCGGLGGAAAPKSACSNHDMVDAGQAYDVQYCCKFPNWAVSGNAPGSVCGPSQPAPHWGVKNGQCLPSCGAAGGNVSPKTSCASLALEDMGPAYDVKYCCKQ